MVRIDAPKVEDIVGSLLLHPKPLSGGQVESDNRVRALWRRIHVCVARSHIENAALCVDGRRVPNGRAGGTEFRMARDGLRWTRLFRDRVSLPDLLSGQRVDGDYISAKGA